MNKRRLAVIATFLVSCTFSAAYGKSYDVALDRTTAVGSVQLPAGTYRVEYTDATATLTNASNRKSYKVPVKVTTAPKKFKVTTIDRDSTVTPEQLLGIELGGSQIRLEFGK